MVVGCISQERPCRPASGERAVRQPTRWSTDTGILQVTGKPGEILVEECVVVVHLLRLIGELLERVVPRFVEAAKHSAVQVFRKMRQRLVEPDRLQLLRNWM